MPLITTIQEAQAQGVRITSVADKMRMPDLTEADNLYLVPALTPALYQTLLTSQTLTPELLQLKTLAKRAAAFLGFAVELPLLHGYITSTGVQTVTDADAPKTFRWEFLQMQDALEQKGFIALEAMWEFLYANKTTLGWNSPQGDTYFFESGKHFARFFPLYQPYRTFENLRNLVPTIVNEKVATNLGEAFLLSLLNQATPSKLTQDILQLLRLAVANFTINRSIEVLPVRMGPQGFTVSLRDNKDMLEQGRNQAPGNQLDVLHRSSLFSANSYLDRAIGILNRHAATEPQFALFLQSDRYTNPATTTENFNANHKIYVL